MSFSVPAYRAPDFSLPPLAGASPARFEPAPADGVAPEGFHATSNFPEYVRMDNGWALCPAGRMDCVVVRRGESLEVVEFRNLRKGDPVLLGRTESGEEGICVHTAGFGSSEESPDKFQFRTRVTRETPFSHDYDFLYDLLRYEKERGFITFVLGPAVSFDRDSRDAMASLIDSGFCHAVLAGNALATHDLEAAMFGTALGQDIYTKRNVPLGHYHHLELLNRVRRSGSTAAAIGEHRLRGGIVDACIRKGIPLVLAGSIRDDGPLPEVIADAYRSQDAMRAVAQKSTTVIALATQLHAIAFGNMLPSYRAEGGSVRPVYFYIVDISEFAVDKLANRGSFQATGISTNVQDFCVNLRRALIG